MIFQQFNPVGRLDVLTNALIGRMNHVSTLRSVLQLWSESDIALALSALDQLDIASLADRARLGRDDLRANMGPLAPSREADRQADSDFHYGR